jgi:hypothetical protein
MHQNLQEHLPAPPLSGYAYAFADTTPYAYSYAPPAPAWLRALRACDRVGYTAGRAFWRGWDRLWAEWRQTRRAIGRRRVLWRFRLSSWVTTAKQGADRLLLLVASFLQVITTPIYILLAFIKIASGSDDF